ncbi:MAG: NAD-dependent epimerase/dehydratase family protein [Flavobacterium sp.]
MKKTILISGIKGFLAGNLTHLLKDDFIVYGIGKTTEEWNGIQVFSSDRLDEISIVPDFLILCHAAVSSGQTSQSNELLFEVNVGITEKLIQQFSTSKIVYISSASVYDSTCVLIGENSPVNPQSEYALSKLWAEKIVLKRKDAVVIRLSSLFGIGMKENTIIPNYVNQALKNGTIEVWGKGKREQNYIHVSDACKCIKSAIQNFDSVIGKILLGVSKEEYSNGALAQIISKETNAKLVYINEDHSKSLLYNNDLTCELLGWAPKADFGKEIHNYIQWKRQF